MEAPSKSGSEIWITREIAVAAACVKRRDSERNTYCKKEQITTRLWRDKRNLIFKNNSDRVVPNLLTKMLHCIIILKTRNSNYHVVDTLKI